MTNQVTFTFNLNEVTVTIPTQGGETKKELLELGQQAFIQEISKKFPNFTYSMHEGNDIPVTNPSRGVVVRDGKKGELGIITNVNPKTIDVALKGGRILRGHPTAFVQVDKKDYKLKDVMWERTKGAKSMGWSEGDTGFLVVQGSKVVPVVFGASKGKDYKAFVIGEEGKFYTLNTNQLRFVYDTKKEAQATIQK